MVKKFQFTEENFDEIEKYDRCDRINDAKDNLINLIKDKRDGLKILSNKAMILMSYQGAIIANCLNKIDILSQYGIYYISIISAYIICFAFTGYNFLSASKIDSHYIPPKILLNSKSNVLSNIEYNYMLCNHLDKINLSNDKIIAKRNLILITSLLMSFILPICFIVFGELYLHLLSQDHQMIVYVLC